MRITSLKTWQKCWSLWQKTIKKGVLTLVESWLERLIAWSRASINSRFKRLTSFAWRCSSVVEPYIDETPDINEIWLPWATEKRDDKCHKKIGRHKITICKITFIIFLRICKPMICVWWWMKANKTTCWWWLSDR